MIYKTGTRGTEEKFYLLIHPVDNHLFNTSYMPGHKSGSGDKTVNKSHPVPSFKEFTKRCKGISHRDKQQDKAGAE